MSLKRIKTVILDVSPQILLKKALLMTSEQQFAVMEMSIWSLCQLKPRVCLSPLSVNKFKTWKELDAFCWPFMCFHSLDTSLFTAFVDRNITLWRKEVAFTLYMTSSATSTCRIFYIFSLEFIFLVLSHHFLQCFHAGRLSGSLLEGHNSNYEKTEQLFLQAIRTRWCQISVPLPTSVFRLPSSISCALTYVMYCVLGTQCK